MGLHAFFVFDAFTEFFSALTALFVAYYSLKAYKILDDSRMVALNLGFSILGVGMLVHGAIKVRIALAVLSGVPVPPAKRLPLVRLGYTLAFATELAAYALILLATIKKPSSQELEATLVPPLAAPLLEYDFRSEALLAVLALLIAVKAGIGYSQGESRLAGLVSLGFALLAVGHLLLVFGGPLKLIAADVARLLGFACLLWMVVKVSRVGA
ncbi:MAG TPA: hypothetical protein ENF83_03860 [Candidatus Korarchaeota archaeon]|nr:hypothetical protein [Candidatus Korarchaeota archaeon]